MTTFRSTGFVLITITASFLGACDPTPTPNAHRQDDGLGGPAAPPPSPAEDETSVPLPSQPPEATDNSVSVLPVFFVARDADLTDAELTKYSYRVLKHLLITQRFYFEKLRTETFRIADKARVYRSPHAAVTYGDPMTDMENEEIGHRKVKEVLTWLGEDRFTSRHVIVTLFVRPRDQPCGDDGNHTPCLGFGRPFSGGSPVLGGGGIVELDFADLVNHDTKPFQSTLAHELGHAFGLAHSDCHGRDLFSDDSIMSYNLAHHSRGYVESATPGTLNPEDYFVLAQNKGVFPSFQFVPSVHNPSGESLATLKVDACFIPPMGESFGVAPPTSPQGYRLFYDGKLVSGPETAYWHFLQGKENCSQMTAQHPTVAVTCTFNGAPIDLRP